MARARDLTGQRFARLKVVERAGSRNHQACWRCQCDCGNQPVVMGRYLWRGRVRSCGCLRRERAAEGARTHGLRHHPLNGTWRNVVQRCTNPKCKGYKNYGGRGVAVCARWQGPSGFPNFLADMGEKPSPEHSLDRIDNDGPYSPGNCRWATRLEQSANQRPRAASAATVRRALERSDPEVLQVLSDFGYQQKGRDGNPV